MSNNIESNLVDLYRVLYKDLYENSNNTSDVSKVVDENGEPLVVYHGAPYGGFSSFDNSTVQNTVGGGSAINHSFFTSDLNAALRYADSY